MDPTEPNDSPLNFDSQAIAERIAATIGAAVAELAVKVVARVEAEMQTLISERLRDLSDPKQN